MTSEKQLPLATLMQCKVIDGGLAGVAGVTATFPLDLAKTRLQKQMVPVGGVPKYKNMMHTVAVVAREEGAAGLYSGYKVNVSFIVFEKAVKLVCNDFFRHLLTDKDSGKISLGAECLAGSSAGAMQSAVTTPMELLKIKGQVAASQGKSFDTIKVMSNIMKTEGPRGFYRGWCSTLVRDVPFSFLYFPLYANLKNTETFGNGTSFIGNLSAGMVAGMVAGGGSTPFDVVKTRLQDLPAGQTQSWVDCVKETHAKEGTKAFFKGTGPRMICIGALFAVAQGFYELGIGKSILVGK